MVASVSPPTLAVPTSTAKIAPGAAKAVKAADVALNSLLQDTNFLQSLSDQSAPYVPVSKNKVLATLWGLINTSGSSSISKDDLRTAVYAEGGSTGSADALWAQLDPKKKATLNAADFATNDYLNKAVTANLKPLLASVEDTRSKSAANAGTSGSVLDYFLSGGGSGSVLDAFA